MAFKQKSGSPFQRNFGIGKSPAKQTSPMKDTRGTPGSPDDRSHKNYTQHKPDGSHVREEEETVPTQMKSPLEHSRAKLEKADPKTGKIYVDDETVELPFHSPGSTDATWPEGHPENHPGKNKPSPGREDRALQMKSPMKTAGGTFIRNWGSETDEEVENLQSNQGNQISNTEAEKILNVQKAAQDYMDANENMDYDKLEVGMRKIYDKAGVDFDKYRSSEISFTGLDRFTNPLSDEYDETIKTKEDLDKKAEITPRPKQFLDAAGNETDVQFTTDPKTGRKISNETNPVFYEDQRNVYEQASSYEDFHGADEAELQEQLDREALTD